MRTPHPCRAAGWQQEQKSPMPPAPLTNYVSLVKSLSLSESPFSHLENEAKDTPHYRTIGSH